MFGVPVQWAAVGGVCLAVSAYALGHHYGWLDRDADMQREIAQRNEAARATEQAMAAALRQKEDALRKAKNDIDKKRAAMAVLADAGRLRLPAASCVQTAAGAPAAGGDREDASELERQTVAALIDLAATGDRAIVQLNQCIAAYDEVRTLINDHR